MNPLQLGCTSKYGDSFVLPERRQNDPALALFRSWLLQEPAGLPLAKHARRALHSSRRQWAREWRSGRSPCLT